MHMAQRMLLPLTVSCFSKIHIGFSFLVVRDKRLLNGCVCVCNQPALGKFTWDSINAVFVN